MTTTNEDRLARFEQMKAAIQSNFDDADAEMSKLKREGKEKTATFRMLFGKRTLYRQMLSLYDIYGLSEKGTVKSIR